MAKGRQTKRSKGTEQSTKLDEPLGSHSLASFEIDDEERQLESLLFGKSTNIGKQNAFVHMIDHDGSTEHLGQLPGDELFYADAGDVAPVVLDNESMDDAKDSNVELFDPLRGASRSASPLASDPDEVHAPDPLPVDPVAGPSKKRNAWVDPADEQLRVSLKDEKRLRKLRSSLQDDTLNGREYERRLRGHFEKINPTPAWTMTAREKLHPELRKRRRASVSSHSSEDSDPSGDIDELLRSSDAIMGSTGRPKALQKGRLDILGLRDANQSEASSGEVASVRFHPSPSVPILLTAGSDRRLRLFNIDCLTNPLLQVVHFPKIPVSNAQFHPSGRSILVTGKRPFFSTYDLQSGAVIESPRDLWSNSTFASDGLSEADRNMDICKFSPDGKLLAVAGRNGYVHLLHCGANNASAQLMGNLKINGQVKDLHWYSKHEPGLLGVTSNHAKYELATVSPDGQICTWDVGSRRCISAKADQDAYGATTISSTSDAKYWSVGTTSGVVNIYDEPAILSMSNSKPTALKGIENLVTPLTTAQFDTSGQILALASKYKPQQLRLVHLPSLTVFQNWPTAASPLGIVTSVDFAPQSDLMAIGNSRGRALLYNIRHFGTR